MNFVKMKIFFIFIFFSIFVSLKASSFEYEIENESCKVGTWIPNVLYQYNIDELHSNEVYILNVSSSGVSSINLDNSDFINLNFQNEFVILTPTNRMKDFIRDQNGESYFMIKLLVTCNNPGQQFEITIEFQIQDENNSEPQFNKSEYNLEINLPWNLNIPTNQLAKIPIEIIDQDLLPENAQVSISIDNQYFRAELTQITDKKWPFKFHVDIFMTNRLVPGNHSFNLQAFDKFNKNNQLSTCAINLQISDYPSEEIPRPSFFSDFYETSLAEELENLQPGKVIRLNAPLKASDPDGYNVELTLIRDESEIFELVFENGEYQLRIRNDVTDFSALKDSLMTLLILAKTEIRNTETKMAVNIQFQREEFTTNCPIRPTDAPPSKGILLDNISDLELDPNWTINCKYGHNFTNLPSQCRPNSQIPTSSEAGFWTACNPSNCRIEYNYNHPGIIPKGFSIRSFVRGNGLFYMGTNFNHAIWSSHFGQTGVWVEKYIDLETEGHRTSDQMKFMLIIPNAENSRGNMAFIDKIWIEN